MMELCLTTRFTLDALLDDGTMFDYEIQFAHGCPIAIFCSTQREQNRML